MILRLLTYLVTPQRRRLSEISDSARGSARHAEPELGYEALDMAHVNRVNRHNAALDGVSKAAQSGPNRWGSPSANMPQAVVFNDNDADYARKYFKKFQKGKSLK
jgi:hypothetical protein